MFSKTSRLHFQLKTNSSKWCIVLQTEPYKKELTNWGSIHIAKNKELMNFDFLAADYLTKKFILNPAGNSILSYIAQLQQSILIYNESMMLL